MPKAEEIATKIENEKEKEKPDKKESERQEYNPAEEYLKGIAERDAKMAELNQKYEDLVKQNKSLTHAVLNGREAVKEEQIDHEANQKRIQELSKKLFTKDNSIYPSNYDFAKDLLELADLYEVEKNVNIFENPLLADRNEIKIDKEGAANFESYLRYAVEEFKDAPHLFQADLEHRFK